MESSNVLIQLDPLDNVLIARCTLKEGDRVVISGQPFTLNQSLGLGFKIAKQNIKKGNKNISIKNRTEDQIKEMTLDEVKDIINDYIINGPKRGKRGGKKKETTTVKKIGAKIPTKIEKKTVVMAKKIPTIQKKNKEE